MVKQYHPKAFIIENVPGMATLYWGQIKDEILRRFTNIGYNIECKILCAADYGVPQMRKRLIFMGVRKEIGRPEFPAARPGGLTPAFFLPSLSLLFVFLDPSYSF